MIKRNIKIRVTPEQSKKVQEICFKNGINWASGDKEICFINEPFLYIDKRRVFTYGNNESFFKKHKSEEVDADLFIRTNGICEEECAICGESKDICPNEETCSYRIEYEDTKNDFMEDKLKKLKHNNFEKFGFSADFEGEILKEVNGFYIGYVVAFGVTYATRWNKYGVEEWENGDHFDLTPLKKEWYEDLENNPKAIVNSKGRIYIAWRYKNENIFYDGFFEHIDGVRPATKEELMELLIEKA